MIAYNLWVMRLYMYVYRVARMHNITVGELIRAASNRFMAIEEKKEEEK